MTPPDGVPRPGGPPGDSRRLRAQRAQPRAFEGTRPSLERTRRLLEERRSEVGRDGDEGGVRGGGPRRPRRPGRGGGSRGSGREDTFRRRRLAALVATGGLLVGLWFLVSLFQPFKGDGDGRSA